MCPESGWEEGKGLVEQAKVKRFLLSPELAEVYERLVKEGSL